MRWREAKKRVPKETFPSSPIAPIGKRLKAFIVDSFMLLMPILYVVFYLIFGSRQGFAEHMTQGWLLVLVPYFIITTLFFLRTGQTPGYKAYDIVLLDTKTEQKVSFITLCIRFGLWLVVCAMIVPLLFPLFRKDRLSIYDILSHSAPFTK